MDESKESASNQDHPVRRPLRLPAYDYTSTGAYFFTICTQGRKPFFTIAELYTGLLETWQGLPERFPGVTLDEFVIMPDHIHGIIWLDSSVNNPPTLGQVLAAYKSITTVAWLNYHKRIGKRCAKHLWQRGFHDHVIRNDQDLEDTRQYILDNPVKRQEKLEYEREAKKYHSLSSYLN